MSLDRWIKDDKKAKKKSPNKEKVEEKNDLSESKESKIINDSRSLTKFVLTCSDSKCKYKKTLRKKTLKDKDKICPRCKKEMKIKIIEN